MNLHTCPIDTSVSSGLEISYEELTEATVYKDFDGSKLWKLTKCDITDLSSTHFSLLCLMNDYKSPVQEEEQVVWLLAQIILCSVSIKTYNQSPDITTNIVLSDKPQKSLIAHAYKLNESFTDNHTNFFSVYTYDENCIIRTACITAFLIPKKSNLV